MRTERIDLYRHFGLKKPEGAAGELESYVLETPEQLRVTRRRPAVLILPGGGYRFTSEREAEAVALRFAARGYVPFILRYSCAPHRFPTALREAAMAMGYIRENAGRLEVRPDRVAALGFSAGGHLCGTLGTLYDSPETADIAPPEVVRPDALCLCYPVSVARGKTHEGSFVNLCGGDEALRDALSLDRLVRPDMPPVFLWHTRSDESVPCRGSLLLAAAMEEAGVDFSLHLYRQGKHGLSTADAAVYPAFAVPPVSRGVPGWPETAMEFLEEYDFRIEDTERSVSETNSQGE